MQGSYRGNAYERTCVGSWCGWEEQCKSDPNRGKSEGRLGWCILDRPEVYRGSSRWSGGQRSPMHAHSPLLSTPLPLTPRSKPALLSPLCSVISWAQPEESMILGQTGDGSQITAARLKFAPQCCSSAKCVLSAETSGN